MGGRGWPGGAGCPPPLLFRAVYRVACRAVALCGSSSASQAAKDEPGTTAQERRCPRHRQDTVKAPSRDSAEGAARLLLCLTGGEGRASHHGSDSPDTGPTVACVRPASVGPFHREDGVGWSLSAAAFSRRPLLGSRYWDRHCPSRVSGQGAARLLLCLAVPAGAAAVCLLVPRGLRRQNRGAKSPN